MDPRRYGPGGHLLLDIGHDKGKKKETSFAGESIEVFHQLKAKDFSVETPRVMKSKLRKKIQKMAEEAKEHGWALWKELKKRIEVACEKGVGEGALQWK